MISHVIFVAALALLLGILHVLEHSGPGDDMPH